MPEISSYTQYLPPILWSPESDPSQFLGRMLRILERILTGFPAEAGAAATLVQAAGNQIQVASATEAQQFYPGDILTVDGTTERGRVSNLQGATIVLENNLRKTYSEGTVRLTDSGSFERTIDNLSDLFNPWKTPSDFLPWLAAWVALTPEADWSEYQKRQLIAEIVSIYGQRGLTEGLLTYLDIYAATNAKPRVTIDDGKAVVRVGFAPNGTAQLQTVAYSYAISFPEQDGRPAFSRGVLLHPSAIAVDGEGNYIVTDEGGSEAGQGTELGPWPAALWKLSSTGAVDYSQNTPPGPAVPLPQPLYTGEELTAPKAVVVDTQNRYYVLSVGSGNQSAGIYRFEPPNYAIAIPFVTQTTTPSFPTEFFPVDMVLDASSNSERKFYILDRGKSLAGAISKVFTIIDDGTTISIPAPLDLSDQIVEPTALALAATGHLIVADAKEPASDDDPPTAADLLRVDPTDGSVVTSLLDDLTLEENPLIFPTGLVFETPQLLLVCDTGVRNRVIEVGSHRHRAETAGIYRVDLSQTPPQISQVLAATSLVRPTKMAIDSQGNLIVADRGNAYITPTQRREWRARANEFGVEVLFSQERLTTGSERNKIRFEIIQLLDEQKPGQTTWWISS